MLLKLTTLGVGAAASPRFRPAGLLIEAKDTSVMIDGGRRSQPSGKVDAWLITDERGELKAEIQHLATVRQVAGKVASFKRGDLWIEPRPVVHTNHPAFGYLIRWRGRRVVWAPEFYRFPRWAAHADLMFAEAAGWNRPIRFRAGVGGHLDALSVSGAAQRLGVRRLVFAHIGRPTIRAIDRGDRPPFGEFAHDGQRFLIRAP